MSARDAKPRPAHETPPIAPPAPDPSAAVQRSPKILPRHLERLAVVYVRQSSPHQVLCHRESRARQYALLSHAVALGWPRERVLVIDEDQGQSGKSAECRGGFHRILAEVTMEHVGLVLGLEMSRLARSSRDWHHLLEVCAIFGTVLGDEEGVYDPNDSNDRLLLGLKGTISEFELVTMHNRLERGKLNKAQRGELFYGVPTGYVKVTPERVEFDPDEQVRDVIRLIFDKYDELGTVYGVFHYLMKNSVRIGVRPFHGPSRGQLEWRRPTLPLIYQVIHHPIYAGAYAYGRRPQKRVCTPQGERRTSGPWLPRDQWKVFKRDCVPAYISWERCLANQERMRQNRSRPDTQGSPRQGAALLAGLVVCGTCGYRLRAAYRRKKGPYYTCEQHLYYATEKKCCGLKAAPVDGLVAEQVLRALEPAALHLSLKAIDDVRRERARLDRHWKQRLERVRHEAREAERRYRAVDPENRLVARTLERRWEEALCNERQLADDYDRFLQEKPLCLSDDEKEAIVRLSADVPLLWSSPGTTPKDRKEIIRHLVEKVVVHVRGDSEHVAVTVHWQGGRTSEHEVMRPVGLYEQMRDFDRLMGRITALRREGKTSVQIAGLLKQEGFTPPRRRGGFTAPAIRQLIHRHGLAGVGPEADRLGPDEWRLADLAEELGATRAKLVDWVRRGWLRGRKTSLKEWVAWADRGELRRLRKLGTRWRPGKNIYPAALTTPSKRGEK